MEEKPLPPPQSTGDNTPVTIPEAELLSSSLELPVVPEKPLPPLTEEPIKSAHFARDLYSRRKALVISLAITLGITLVTGLTMAFQFSRQKDDSAFQSSVQTQEIELEKANGASLPSELQGAEQSLLVNGNAIVKGQLKVTNGTSTASFDSEAVKSSQTYKLPNASGVFCLDSNNCNYVTQDQLSRLQQQIPVQGNAGIQSITAGSANLVITNNNGAVSITDTRTTDTSARVNSVNGQSGGLLLQGTPNQISVNTTSGVFTLSLPQDINTGATPTFAGLTVTGLNCSANLNGGSLTTNGSGQLICSDDDAAGGGGTGVTTPGGTNGIIPVFTASDTIANSIISQSGGTISIGGSLTLSSALGVGSGGTGNTSFTSNGVVYGNGSGGLLTTAAPLAGQLLLGNASGIPTFTGVTGDIAITGAGLTTIQADSVALGTDTTGNYVSAITAGNGLSVSGVSGEGSSHTLSVIYGNTANTAVAGNTLLNCPSGTGNLTGGGTAITLGTGGSCANLDTVTTPTFSGSVNTPLVQNSGALTIGNVNQTTLLQGSVTTITSSGLGNDIVLTSADQIRFTGFNCTAFTNGGVLTTDASGNITCANDDGAAAGAVSGTGTTNRLAKFNGTSTITDSNISDNGTVVAIISGAEIQGASGLTLGAPSTAGLLLISDGSNNATTLQSASLSGDITFTLPGSVGSNGQCIKTNGSGVLSFGDCLSGGGMGGGVTSLNGFSSAVTIQGTANQISVNNNAGTITLSTPQDINTAATPTFAGLTLNGSLNVGSNSIIGTTGIIDYTNFDLAANGNITAGTYNGQTISATASFTGTVTTAGLLTASNGLTVTTGTTSIGGALNVTGNATIGANSSITLTGGTTFPGSPSEGQMFFRTDTRQLYIYANSQWQADRSSSSKIVGMGAPSACTGSTPTASFNYFAADYVVNSCTSAQTTINSAITSLGAQGGTVYLMEGTYIIDGEILLTSNVHLVGAGSGTVLKFRDSSAASVHMINNSGTIYRAKVSNLKIDGNRSNQTNTQIGIQTQSGSSTQPGLTIDSVMIENINGTGAYLSGYSTRITNSEFVNINGTAINAGASQNMIISGNTVESTTGTGIYTTDSEYTIISNNQLRNNSAGSIYTLGFDDFITITNNVVEGGAGINTTGGASITGNTVYASTGHGIHLDNSFGGNNKSLVSGNTVVNAATNGIHIISNDNTIVSGNSITNSGGSGSSSGINIAASNNIQVVGNSITDTAGTGYAINNGGTGTYISGNRYSGTGASTINEAGTNTVYAGQLNSSNQFLIQGTAGVILGEDIAVNGGDLTSSATTFNLLSTNVTTLNIGDATTTLNLAGGSGSTGCTIDSSGNLSCTGTITGSGSGGFFSRIGTTIQPSTAGDNIQTTSGGTITSAGLLTASNGLTVTTGATSLGGSLAVTGISTLTGALTVNNTTDINTGNTAALQVRSGSNTVLNVDTTNSRVSIGSIGTATGQLYMGGQVAAGSTGSVSLSTGVGVTVQGRYAYVIDEGTNTLRIYDVSSPASPTLVGNVATASQPNNVVVQGRYAYVTNRTGSPHYLTIYDISNPASPTQTGQVGVGGAFTPRIGAVQGRYAYVTMQGSNTLAIYDISNPASPSLAGSTTTGLSSPYSIAVQGRYAYVGTGANALVSFDISNPASPTQVGSVGTGVTPYKVAVQGRYAYVINQDSDSLTTYNIGNPASMSQIGSVAVGDVPYGLSLQGRYAYTVNAGAPSTMRIIDLTNPASPTQVGSVPAGNQALSIATQGRYAYVVNLGGTSTLSTYDLGGAYIQQLEAGGIETGVLGVSGSASFGNSVSVGGALSVANSLSAGADFVVAGQSLLQGSLAVNGGNLTSSATTFNLLSANVTTLNIGDVATTLNLAGGSGSTGCTIDGSGNLSCTGTITGSGSGGFFSRIGTTIQPTTAGDNIQTTSGGTITAAGTLNANATGKTALSIADSGAQNSGVTIGGDTNLYRSGAATLKTDSNLHIQTTTDATAAFQIQNAAGDALVRADTLNSTLFVTAANESFTYGSNLASNNFAADWIGDPDVEWTRTMTNATHTPSISDDIMLEPSPAMPIEAGALYRVEFTVSGMTAGVIGASIGDASIGGLGVYSVDANGTYSNTVITDNSDNFRFYVSDDFDGTISNVTIQKVTTIKNSPALVVRGSGTTSAVTGSELLSNNFATDWTSGADWTRTSIDATHNSSDDDPITLVSPLVLEDGATYELRFTVSGNTTNDPVYVGFSDSDTIAGVDDDNYVGRIIATADSEVYIQSTQAFDGTISNISLKKVTIAQSALIVQNNDGSTSLTVSSDGMLTTRSDIAVNGGNLTSTASTVNLFSSGVGTINIGDGASTINFTGGLNSTGCTFDSVGSLGCSGTIYSDSLLQSARVVTGIQDTGFGLLSAFDDIGGNTHTLSLRRNLNNAGSVIRIDGASDQALNANILAATRAGEGYALFSIEWGGRLLWSDGINPQDTNLYRSATDTLKTDDLLVVGSFATGSLPTGQNGGLVYDSTLNKLKIYENGQYKILCNQTDGMCGGNASTLQQAYDAGNTITTTDARDINFTLANTTTDANFIVNVATGSTGLFAVQNNGSNTLTVTGAGLLTTSNDIAVNGGDITSTASTFNFLQGNVTTANLLGAATSINIGGTTATNTINIGNGVIGNGNVGTINIGTAANNAAANVITIGSRVPNSSLTLQGGNGGINLYAIGAGNPGVSVYSDNGAEFAFRVVNQAANGNVFAVDTLNNGVAINNFNVAPQASLDIGNGGLRLAGQRLTVNTPLGAPLLSYVNIPMMSMEEYGQYIALGISKCIDPDEVSPTCAVSGYQPNTARAIVVADNRRNGAHQPTIGVYSPEETDIFGFSWEGTTGPTATGYLKTSVGSNIGIRTGGTDVATFQSDGNVAIGKTSANARLDVQGASSGDAFAVSNSTSSGNIATFSDNSTVVATIADGGATTFKNSVDSTAAFVIQKTGSGVELFQVDSTNSRVYIGDTTPDATGVLLVLDNKNTADDPTGVEGAMYYNSATGNFRCFSNGLWGDCGTPSLRDSWFLYEDWTSGTASSTGDVGELGWRRVQTGNASATRQAPGNASQNYGRIGILQIASNATASGIALTLEDGAGSGGVMSGVPGNLRVEFDFSSTLDNIQQSAWLGMHDSTSGTQPSTGMYFSYDVTGSAGNWFRCTANGGSRTCTDTGVAKAAVNTYQRFRIETNTAGTQVDFYINEVLVGSNTTNLPTNTANYTPAIVAYGKDATTRTWQMDYFQVRRSNVNR